MKTIKFKCFDGSIIFLIILLLFAFIPGLIYWIVKRREFSFDILSGDELVPEVERLKKLREKGLITSGEFEEKRDKLLKLGDKANKTAYKRAPNLKIIKKYQSTIEAIRYLEKSCDNIDLIGRKRLAKMIKKYSMKLISIQP